MILNVTHIDMEGRTEDVALKEIRVCELTDEPDAKVVPISIGPFTWHVDLSDNGLKMALETMHPVTSKGTLVSGGEDDTLEETEPDTPPGPVPPAGDEEEAPQLSDDDRAAARFWGKKNWRRLGLKRQPGDRGQLHRVVELGWIKAGRPALPD